MSIQNIRKQGLVRRLQVNNPSGSSNGIIGQIFKMPSRKEHADDAASILIATMNTPIELPKDPKTQKNDEESSGITARNKYRGQFIDHDTIFDNTGNWLKESESSLISYETPVIYLDKSYEYEQG